MGLNHQREISVLFEFQREALLRGKNDTKIKIRLTEKRAFKSGVRYRHELERHANYTEANTG